MDADAEAGGSAIALPEHRPGELKLHSLLHIVTDISLNIFCLYKCTYSNTKRMVLTYTNSTFTQKKIQKKVKRLI